jgi:hypothetical protein
MRSSLRKLPAGPNRPAATATARRYNRRFYAKIALDPNRPTSQVSNIAQSILSELDRVRGTKLTLISRAEEAHRVKAKGRLVASPCECGRPF